MAKIRADLVGITIVHRDGAEARQLKAGDDVPDGYTVGEHLLEPEDAGDKGDGGAVEIPEGDPDKKWTVAQLTAYAAREGIDVGGATKKDDLLSAITGA